MSYLVYCILNGDRKEPAERPRFPGYPDAAILARSAGLAAAASNTVAADAAPDVARLLVYSKIVEWFNRDRTVVPMRYGCIFRDLGEIAKFLDTHKDRYVPLLEQLKGKAEMSVRIALRESAPAPLSLASRSGELHTNSTGTSSGSGAAYLAARRDYYALQQAAEKRREDTCRAIREMAEGTYVAFKSEYGVTDGQGLLSLHFLVVRARIDDFKEALRPLSAASRKSIIVTGPWPPYNFTG